MMTSVSGAPPFLMRFNSSMPSICRHLWVSEDQVKRVCVQSVERLLSIGNRFQLVAVDRELVREIGAIHFLMIDNEDLHTAVRKPVAGALLWPARRLTVCGEPETREKPEGEMLGPASCPTR